MPLTTVTMSQTPPVVHSASDAVHAHTSATTSAQAYDKVDHLQRLPQHPVDNNDNAFDANRVVFRTHRFHYPCPQQSGPPATPPATPPGTPRHDAIKDTSGNASQNASRNASQNTVHNQSGAGNVSCVGGYCWAVDSVVGWSNGNRGTRSVAGQGY